QWIRTLLAMSPAEQEAALLRALIDHHLAQRGGKDSKPDGIVKRFEHLKTAEELIAELMRLAQEDPNAWAHSTFRVVSKGGMAKTLAVLEKLPKDKLPWTAEQCKWIFDDIRTRLGKGKHTASDEPAPQDDVAPPAEKLAGWRRTLANRESRQWGEAFVG